MKMDNVVSLFNKDKSKGYMRMRHSSDKIDLLFLEETLSSWYADWVVRRKLLESAIENISEYFISLNATKIYFDEAPQCRINDSESRCCFVNVDFGDDKLKQYHCKFVDIDTWAYAEGEN
jgi:hypothetical protein